jgi:hypothetical protein
MLSAEMIMDDDANWAATKADVNMLIIRLMNERHIKLAETLVVPGGGKK